MKKPLTDEDIQIRASIDGRVAFAMASFLVAGALVALLDRVGVPERLVGVLGPVIVLAGLALIGLLLHAVRVSRFYAAGRAVPAPYAGLAMAALMTGLLLPFLPPVPDQTPAAGLMAGFAAGFVLASLAAGPLLRKTGAFSLPDLIASRFPHLGVRLGMVAVIAAAGGAIGLAGLESSVHAVALALGAQRFAAAALCGLVLLLMVVPGGMSGVVWAATGAAGIFIAGLALPLGGIMLSGEALPLPLLGDGGQWRTAAAMIGEWHKAPVESSGTILLAAAAGLGIATLAPLIAPASSVMDTSAARRAGLSALVWCTAAVAVLAATMALSALATSEWIAGERPDRLPDFVYAASSAGMLGICGKFVATPQAALAACEQLRGFAGLVLRPEDFSPGGLWLVIGMPELRGFSTAFSGLAGAGLVAIALVLSGAGFQTLGTALGHDALYRVRDNAALTSRRLAMTRMVIIAAIFISAAILSQIYIDPRMLIGLAVVLSAATVTPLLALALWPRATGSDAAIALLAGLATAGAVITIGGGPPNIATLALASVLAACMGLLAGIVTSFLHSGGIATEGAAFVHGVLHGESDVLNTDTAA